MESGTGANPPRFSLAEALPSACSSVFFRRVRYIPMRKIAWLAPPLIQFSRHGGRDRMSITPSESVFSSSLRSRRRLPNQRPDNCILHHLVEYISFMQTAQTSQNATFMGPTHFPRPEPGEAVLVLIKNVVARLASSHPRFSAGTPLQGL